MYACNQSVLFKNVELPNVWDTSSETMKVDDSLFYKCASQTIQQIKLDIQPFGIGLCYSCGGVLWNPSHAHHSGLVKFTGMTPDDAPATAWVQSI